MLPPAVVDTARNGLRVAIGERRELLRHEIADLKEQYGMRGTLHGTPYLQAVKQRVASELKIRANLAWQRWARALATQPSVPLADLRSTLIGEIERPVRTDAESADLAEYYFEAKRFASALGEPADTLARMQQEAIEQVAPEVEFAILEATKTQPAGAQTAMFSFYPPIGVVQTGAGATASVQQTLGATDRETRLHALQAVEQAIAPAIDLAPTDRTQITAVVVALRDELAKPQPNLLRLRSGLVGIAPTIQTRGAAAAAYQLVKGALALLGVHLT
jgi:hypothetical protein